jgi:hypothetical protein
MMSTRSAILCLSLFCALVFCLEAAAEKTMSVQVRESQLRATPSHLGKVIGKASYGDRVSVLEEKGDWKKVSLPGQKAQGWMHVTALTAKRIVLKAGQTGVSSSVSRDEIALAGKGFSEEVEARYRQSNKNLDYTWIDRMEAIKVSPEQMESFITKGSLAANGGGRP